ncbi:MAG: FAD-linked oxidase C-terminal domain-containing protein [Opitutales bacterium]
MTGQDDEAGAGLTALRAALGEVVSTAEGDLRRVSFDAMKIAFSPDAVVTPTADEQVGELLCLANEFEVPVTARGAGSSLTGSAVPVQGGWVLDLSQMNAFSIDRDERICVAQAGAVVADIQAAADKVGLFYPPDPSSKKFCTIGGNVACNAGGLRCVKYGVTRDYVRALGGYLPTGEKVQWGRATRKFATGYNLRDLWIGSEGTLGVVTEVTLGLVLKPACRRTFLAAFADEATALEAPFALPRLGLQPSILEFLDQWTVSCVEAFTGKTVLDGVSGLPVLLVELDGHPAQVEESAEKLLGWLKERAAALRTAANEDEAEELWEVRRTGSPAMRQLANTKLNEDVVVPLRKQVELVEFVNELRVERDLRIGTFGHCGDGNLHVNFMYDREDADEAERARIALDELMSKVVELGGAISGEHGIGLAKTEFVRRQFNDAEWDAMQAIKNTLDPNGILNPRKIFHPFRPWEHVPVNETLPWEHGEEECQPFDS